jgi:hypothetical protein
MGDFLRIEARLPHRERFRIAGVLGEISTNCEAILDAARESFCSEEDRGAALALSCRFWVDPSGTTQAPWPKPLYRGLDHLIFMGLDAQSSILIDLKTRRALGRFSPAMALDQQRWRTVIFPNLVSLTGPALGITELHCACMVRNGKGLLLWGPSGAGKSTLSMALAHEGFEFLADDWTYFSRDTEHLTAWGLIPRLKLLPSASVYFPELAQCAAATTENGEEAIEIDPFRNLGIRRSRSCEPRALIFLERTPHPEFSVTRLSLSEAASHLEENLLADAPETIEPQRETIRRLVECGPWRLHYGEPPDVVARKLSEFFA